MGWRALVDQIRYRPYSLWLTASFRASRYSRAVLDVGVL